MRVGSPFRRRRSRPPECHHTRTLLQDSQEPFPPLYYLPFHPPLTNYHTPLERGHFNNPSGLRQVGNLVLIYRPRTVATQYHPPHRQPIPHHHSSPKYCLATLRRGVRTNGDFGCETLLPRPQQSRHRSAARTAQFRESAERPNGIWYRHHRRGK